jgi:membrane protein
MRNNFLRREMDSFSCKTTPPNPAMRASGLKMKIAQELKRMAPLRFAKLIWTEIRVDDVFGRSAQLAYYSFLALFPFCICVIASLSVFGNADRGRALLEVLFARILPGTADQLIDRTFGEIIQFGGPLKMSFGILASLWSASMGMSALMDTLNAAYRVKETRTLIEQYATAVGLTASLTALAVVSLLVALFGNLLVGADSPNRGIALAWIVMRWPLALGTLFIALAVAYHFGPNLKRRPWRWITPGSVFGVFLLAAVSVGLRIYVQYSRNYSAAYGSLGAVIVLLIAFYLAGIAILSGGVLNGVLERIANKQKL